MYGDVAITLFIITLAALLIWVNGEQSDVKSAYEDIVGFKEMSGRIQNMDDMVDQFKRLPPEVIQSTQAQLLFHETSPVFTAVGEAIDKLAKAVTEGPNQLTRAREEMHKTIAPLEEQIKRMTISNLHEDAQLPKIPDGYKLSFDAEKGFEVVKDDTAELEHSRLNRKRSQKKKDKAGEATDEPKKQKKNTTKTRKANDPRESAERARRERDKGNTHSKQVKEAVRKIQLQDR